MIWVFIFLYLLPVLIGLDLMKLLFYVAKEEGEDIYLYHIILAIIVVIMPIINVIIDGFIIGALAEEHEVEELKKYSYIIKLLYFKL